MYSDEAFHTAMRPRNKNSLTTYLKKTKFSLVNVKTEVLMIVIVKNIISWDVAAYSLVDFADILLESFEPRRSKLYLEDGVKMFLWNVGNVLLQYTVQYPERQYF